MEEIRVINHVGNYRGCLHIAIDKGKYYWMVSSYDTDFDNIKEWSEISKELFTSLFAESDPYEKED